MNNQQLVLNEGGFRMEHFEDLFEKGKPPCKACLLSFAEMLLAIRKASEFSTY